MDGLSLGLEQLDISWHVHLKPLTSVSAHTNTGPPSRDTSNSDDDSVVVAGNQRAWVKQCRNSAIVVTAIWVTWVVIVQVLAPDRFPYSLYVRYPNEEDYSGW